MTENATLNTQLANTVAFEGVATNLLLAEWIVKLQQQLSVKQRLIEEQQQQISEQHKEIEELASGARLASKTVPRKIVQFPLHQTN